MSLTFQQVDAIYKLNPTVAVLRGDIAYDVDGNEVTYDLDTVTAQAQKDACKEKAKQLLAQTDWAALPDVSLANQDAFISFRSALRNLVINPVADAVFETIPKAIWS